MTGSDLQPVSPSIPRGQEIEDLTRLGNALGQSGFFKDIRSGYQAFAKLLFGRDLGLSATAAMTGIHIIEGKPEISANVQAQMVRTYMGPEGERYDYRVREHTPQACMIEFLIRRDRDGEWETLGSSTYTLEDAKRAGLDGKTNWKRHPRNMLFARAMSDGVAFHCPEVTNGIRTYHENEIDVDGHEHLAAPATPNGGTLPEAVEGQVVEEDRPAPDPELIDSLMAAKDEVPASWLAMQLVAVGLDDAPDRITKATLKRLDTEQARELLSAINAKIDEREAAKA